jgi:hypothetical protein
MERKKYQSQIDYIKRMRVEHPRKYASQQIKVYLKKLVKDGMKEDEIQGLVSDLLEQIS